MKVTKKQVAEFTTQAEAGDLESQTKLADMYCYGWGVPEDKQKAIFWYRKAIEQGSMDALVNSEFCFTETLGYEAVEYYRRLAENGNMEAQIILASLYDEGRCVPKNDAEAFRLRMQAAELHNGHACHLVGHHLLQEMPLERMSRRELSGF
jgi:TPR repeat protein